MSDAQAQRKTETIPQWKREEVDEIVDMLESYDSVGVVSITGIPSKQLQAMRRGLHGTAELRVSRNTLLWRALDEVGRDDLQEFLSGQVGLVGTNDNPFALYRQLEESKTPAPINAGEVAPNDIVIPEGDTGVEDGQFIGDLKQVGVDSRFQDGSVAVSETTTVLETGEEVSDQLANVLSTLEMEPKEVGLDLRGVVSDGVLFGPEELDIDVEDYRADLEAATAQAHNLAVNAAVPTAETAGTLLSKVESEVTALAVEAGVVNPDTAGGLLAAADADVRALAGAIDDDEALPEELQGVEPSPAETTESAEEDTSDEAETGDEAEADAEDDAEDDDDDDDAAAEGLGNMFG